jgi:superfamily I DNA/RNA helicase
MNYRSTNQICNYANSFSKKFADEAYRIEMIGQRDGEEVVDKSTPEPEEYTSINLDSVDDMLNDLKPLSGTSAILCRTNKEVDAISDYLTGRGIQHTTKHGTKIPRLIECALSDEYMQSYLASHLSSAKYGEYIRLTADKAPDINWFLATYGDNTKISADSKKILKLREISTLLISNTDKLREIKKVLKVDIPYTDQDLFGKSLLYYIRDTVQEIKSNELYVGTIHSVKGLEYDNVCVANVGSYCFQLGDEEMNNLFYVAITRAKNRLFVYRI